MPLFSFNWFRETPAISLTSVVSVDRWEKRARVRFQPLFLSLSLSVAISSSSLHCQLCAGRRTRRWRRRQRAERGKHRLEEIIVREYSKWVEKFGRFLFVNKGFVVDCECNFRWFRSYRIQKVSFFYNLLF